MKKLWAKFKRTVEKRGQTGKKVRGDTLWGDTGVKSIKIDRIDSDEQKGRNF